MVTEKIKTMSKIKSALRLYYSFCDALNELNDLRLICDAHKSIEGDYVYMAGAHHETTEAYVKLEYAKEEVNQEIVKMINSEFFAKVKPETCGFIDETVEHNFITIYGHEIDSDRYIHKQYIISEID